MNRKKERTTIRIILKGNLPTRFVGAFLGAGFRGGGRGGGGEQIHRSEFEKVKKFLEHRKNLQANPKSKKSCCARQFHKLTKEQSYQPTYQPTKVNPTNLKKTTSNQKSEAFVAHQKSS